ncbi:MAG: decarboxylase, partial [Pseudomonadota bacterium]|nr:decarboxylase [Pseudomonadota bacterium]
MESFDKSSLKIESRAKIGIIVPPTNTVNEIEWNLMVPSGVSVHSTRMPLHSSLQNKGAKQKLFDDVRVATCYLSQANLNVIAYGCTAGSMILPLSELSDFMQNIANTPCITTAASIVNALRAIVKTKVALSTPYHKQLNVDDVVFLESVGMKVIHNEGLGIGSG